MKCTVFVDGDFLIKEDIFLEAMTPGILEARGVFETMRADDGHIHLLENHLNRLRKGLKVLNIRLPYTSKELHAIIHKVLIFNQLKNARLRLMAYQKNGSFELTVIAMPRKVLTEKEYQSGYSVTVLDCPGRTQKYANVKSLDYGRFREAFLKAGQLGYHEALLTNSNGYVFEASRANIFYVKDGVLHTPSLSLGCLDGITRQMVVDCAREHKINVKMVKPHIKDFQECDEAFLTNAILGVMPITKINAKTIRLGRIGDITYQLRNWYLKKILPPNPIVNPLLACV
jgi:branched-subunit amino acid aminotransferase/4-amino-4-deoxychorismate lyase